MRIPLSFPAVIYSDRHGYTQDEFENKEFFWHGYMPMVIQILSEA